jgi:hypothetical protein
MGASPNVIEGQSSKNDENRFPFSGSIDQIGSDIQRLKEMGVNHIVLVYNFLRMGRKVNEMIDTSKQLSSNQILKRVVLIERECEQGIMTAEAEPLEQVASDSV